MSAGESRLAYDGLSAFAGPKLITEVPGPEAMAWVERDRKVTSPSLPRAYPFVPKRGAGIHRGGRRRQHLPRPERGHRGHVHRATAHPRVVEAIHRQAAELLHYSASDFFLPFYAEVCERLDEMAPFGGARPGRS